MNVKEIVLLWYETQMGCMHKCKEKQHEFDDIMWKLYEEFADIQDEHLNGNDNTDN